MTPFPKGSYIVRDGERRKILEELGDLRFLSLIEQLVDERCSVAIFGTVRTIQELERDGWKVESEDEGEWQPKFKAIYWYLNTNSDDIVGESYWEGDELDQARKNSLGIFKTREAAKAAFEVAKEAIRKMK